MPDPAIRLADVTVRFAEKRLAFDCTIPAGAAVAVAGPSGAGKSTLFNVIAGFERPAGGSVALFGEDMAGRDPAERPVSVVFQDNNLFAHLSVADNIGLGIDPGLKLDAAGREAVDAALTRVGLAGYGMRLPGSLSGVNGSALRLPARWCAAGRSCCWMNPSPHSTRLCGRIWHG